jgi:hypothetical protein
VPPEQPGLTLDVPPEADDPVESVRPPAPKEERPPRERRPKRQKVVARRVRRIVRRVDSWSVLKVSLVFYLCGYIVTMVAGVLLWSVAVRLDVVDKVEDFIEELGAYETFEFLPDVIFKRSLLIGGILVIVATGLTVLSAVLFNLISDLVGGIRVTVLEEESARPVQRRPDGVARAEREATAPGPAAPRVETHRVESDALGASSLSGRPGL